jgi:hypothetical protein
MRARTSLVGCLLLAMTLLAAPAGAREQAPNELLDTAVQRALQRQAACRLPRPRQSQAVPQRSLLDLLAPLRREQAPDDALPVPMRGPFAKVVFLRYSRFLRRVGNTRYFLVPITPRRSVVLPTAACDRAVMRELKVVVRRSSPGVRRRAGRFARRRLARLRRLERVRHDGVTVLSISDDRWSVFTGGSPAALFERRGIFSTSSTSADASRVQLLVPDEVAAVDLSYDAATDRDGRPLPSATFRASVESNLAVLEVERPAEDAFRARITWFDATGAAIRTYRS